MGVRAGTREWSTLQRCEQIKLIRVLSSGETEAAGAGEGTLGPCHPAEKRGKNVLNAGLRSHLHTLSASVDMLIAGEKMVGSVEMGKKKNPAAASGV